MVFGRLYGSESGSTAVVLQEPYKDPPPLTQSKQEAAPREQGAIWGWGAATAHHDLTSG